MFRKSKKAILIDESGFDWQEVKLKRIGNTYVDTLTGKTFPLNGKPIRFNGKLTYLLDAEKGVVLEPQKSKEVLNLKTNPELLSTIIEPEILHRAFKFRPAMKTIIAAFFVGLAAGALFFAPVI
ncbi:hypothetical protein [Geoglobus acetivorans]|uniref:Uncharacterized protein n=1 Tax=Geoglobus acetivorans TaxID=565033 RepID=A0A0A7GGF8_GEOAI|nr:hypothetical protein GACE_2100 [Geoglobus acetivorans]